MKISRQRIRAARPVSGIARSYVAVAGFFCCFLLFLFAIVALERFILG